MRGRAFFAMAAGLCASLFAAAAQAATYHVAPGGDDAADGSPERPWRTLQRAADSVQAGDRVSVAAGDYDGFNLENKAGTAEEPIVFSAAPGARVVRPGSMPQHLLLNPEALKRTWPKWPHGVHVWGSSHVILEGFEVVGMPATEMGPDDKPLHRGGAGFHVEVSHHVTLRKNRADDNGRWGILTGFSHDILIEDNECSRSHSEHGIYVGNSGDRPILRRNHVWGNGGAGIQINADNNYESLDYQALGGVVDGIISEAVVEANVIHGNGHEGGAAINLDGVQDSLVANNLLYDNHAWGVALFQIDGAEGSRRNRVVHNTIVMAEDGRYAIQIADCPTVDPATDVCAEASDPPFDDWVGPPGRATGSTGNIVANNILLNLNPDAGSIRIDARSLEKGAASGEPFRSDGNVVIDRLALSASDDEEDDEVLSLSAWQAQVEGDTRSLVAAEGELFQDPGAEDFSLLPGSPAVDRGWKEQALARDRLGHARPVGVGPDIGAYELGGVGGEALGGVAGESDETPGAEHARADEAAEAGGCSVARSSSTSGALTAPLAAAAALLVARRRRRAAR